MSSMKLKYEKTSKCIVFRSGSANADAIFFKAKVCFPNRLYLLIYFQILLNSQCCKRLQEVTCLMIQFYLFYIYSFHLFRLKT